MTKTHASLLSVAAAMVLSAVSSVGPPSAAAAPATAGHPLSCFPALAAPMADRLVCQHDAWLTDDERADIARLTRGLVRDARCTVSVDVASQLIAEAMAASDRVIDIPSQPVACRIETTGGPLTVGGTFAPHVVFKDGFAIKATPGLANITGVNSYLAWPVVAYVNRAAGIESEMLAMINAFRSARSGKEARN